MEDYEEKLLKLMNIMERMVDLQDRMVEKIETLSKEVEDLRAKVDGRDSGDPVSISRLN